MHGLMEMLKKTFLFLGKNAVTTSFKNYIFLQNFTDYNPWKPNILNKIAWSIAHGNPGKKLFSGKSMVYSACKCPKMAGCVLIFDAKI